MEPFNLYTTLRLGEGEEIQALAVTKDAVFLGLRNGRLLHCVFFQDKDNLVSFNPVVPVNSF